jgi:hypothetical protein
MKKIYLLAILITSTLLGGCDKKEIIITPTQSPSVAPTTVIQETVAPTKEENKMCDWVDKSDVIIKLNFEEGIVKDTSYEAGFIYKKGPNMIELRLARLARSQCDYRVGFNKSDFKDLKAATIGVWTYNGTNRQKIKNEPIMVDFSDQMPDFGKNIEVEVIK